ncbi:hypothetical protein KUTeg_013368 [Tegillarca granosa]|uniref:WSC domain-containing protein n=1 Tax=Tegillarca granosa TaxID=220873 RepID=A0ABQ9ETI0_TEGGR|nr:hypothetical protein KUTeg_013368 [Tegillarca granosa]
MTIRLNNYVGCYEDKRHRILSNKQTNDKKMTISKCKAICRRYKYYGLENKKECFCGNQLRKYKKKSNSECKMPCGGNKSENFLVFYTESSSTSFISKTLSVIRLNNYELSLTSTNPEKPQEEEEEITTKGLTESSNLTFAMFLIAFK